jgi:hypothetical protein
MLLKTLKSEVREMNALSAEFGYTTSEYFLNFICNLFVDLVM